LGLWDAVHRQLATAGDVAAERTRPTPQAGHGEADPSRDRGCVRWGV